MSPKVISQVTLSRESLFAPWYGAREGLFSRVNPHVSLEVALFSKGLLTIG